MSQYHIIPGFPASMSPSSHAAEADNFVFLTGQFGRDIDHPEDPLPEGIEAQTARALSNMKRTLESLDLSMSDVLSVRVFLTEFHRDYDAMNAAYRKFFEEGRRPTRTCIGVTALVRNALIELDCIAYRGKQSS